MTQGLGAAKKATRTALGRGLSALVSSAPVSTTPPTTTPSFTETASNIDTPVIGNDRTTLASPQKQEPQGGVTFLPLTEISANPEQPRTHFSETEISELCESIKTLGVLQPILVRPMGQGYQIVAGERRFRAATRAGLSQVPALIRELSERETLEIALVENVQRQGLNPIEEAQGYQRLMEDFSLTAQEVAERVGKDRATVANTARLLKLPSVVQDMLKDGRISVGHAKAILTVKEPVAQIGLANKIVNENLSVRAIEAIVSREVVLDNPKRVGNNDSSGNTKSATSATHPELEERLRNSLGTKVTIHRSRKGGSIELHFYSDEELDRLLHILA
jgi:ParB family chromosome partitioning protein